MNSAATRQAALLQARLKLITDQREFLTELGDIKESRRLIQEVTLVVAEAAARGLTPPNPLDAVACEWRRLAAWSDRVQETLITVNAKCAEAPSLDPKATSKPSRDWLERWRTALETAREEFIRSLAEARVRTHPDDWINGKPHPETIEVSNIIATDEQLKVAADEAGKLTATNRENILLASWRVAQSNSAEALDTQRNIQTALDKAAAALNLHGQHRAALERAEQLTAAGELATASRLLYETPQLFSDLPYDDAGKAITKLKTEIDDRECRVADVVMSAAALRSASAGFALLPPHGLIKRTKSAVTGLSQLAREVDVDIRHYSAGEARVRHDKMAASIYSELHCLQSATIPALVRKSRLLCAFWLLAAGGLAVGLVLTFQSLRRQIAEQKMLAAIAKTEADGKERERMRLESELTLKAEAEQRVRFDQWMHMLGNPRGTEDKNENKERDFLFWITLGSPLDAGSRSVLDLAVRWIPAGNYVRGSSTPQWLEPYFDESQHEVTLSRGFFIAETECTQADWKRFMGTATSRFSGDDQLPVESVSWNEAVAFCRTLTLSQRRIGLLPSHWEWRLPTEAEWEYAARAGTVGPLYGDVDLIGWYKNNSDDKPHRVKEKSPNAWGLYDIFGNVMEWCADWYGNYPANTMDPKGPDAGVHRATRGGCFYTIFRDADLGRRSKVIPDLRISILGFRPVLSPIP